MPAKSEIRLHLILITIGYTFNFLLGMIGAMQPSESFWQLTLWQIGDACAIMASILASRYVGTKGVHIVPAGFILLGIAYGVSIAASTFDSLNTDKLATIVLPLFPALLLISIGWFFPIWVRIISALICIPFFIVYYSVINNTYDYSEWPSALAYTGLQVLGIIWTIYFWRDYQLAIKEKK